MQAKDYHAGKGVPGKMRKYLLFLCVLLLPNNPCFSRSPEAGSLEEKFMEGNRHYENKEFVKAAACYEQIIQDHRIRNADLYYNLGNAYMKLNKLGQAIYYYHKALKVRENDPEIRENLAYAERLRVDKIKKPEDSIYAKAFLNFQQVISVNQGTVLAVIFYLLLNVFLFFRILGRPLFPPVLNRYLTGIIIIMILIFISTTGIKIFQNHHYREAVLLAPSLEVRSGPGSDNTALFTIHEGLKVRIRAERGEWVQIRLENGLSGWAKKDEMGII